jgi:hypothetical protein
MNTNNENEQQQDDDLIYLQTHYPEIAERINYHIKNVNDCAKGLQTWIKK